MKKQEKQAGDLTPSQVAIKWRKARKKLGLEEDEVAAVYTLLYQSWRGVLAPELAIIIGCHWRNYSHIRKILNKVEGEYNCKILDFTSRGTLRFTLEENYKIEQAYLKLKSSLKSQYQKGNIPYPDALDKVNQEAHRMAQAAREQRLKEKQQVALEKQNKHHQFVCETVGDLITVDQLANKLNISRVGARKWLDREMAKGTVQLVRPGKRGMGNAAIYSINKTNLSI